MAEPWEDFQPATGGEPWDDFKPAPRRVEVRGTSADPAPSLTAGDLDTMQAATMAQGMGAPDPRPMKDVITEAAGRYGKGFEGGANLMGEAFTNFGNRVAPEDLSLADVAENTRNVQREAAAYRQNPATGVPGMLGSMTPEMLISAGPIMRTGTSMLPLATSMIGKRAAPFAADVTANMGYSAAKSAASGNGITDIMKDAGLGALGAGAGRVAGNAVGRALGGITDDAAALIKAGITPTYGQAFGGNGIIAAAERALSKLPLAGAAVDARKAAAKGQYSEAEITQALRETGIPHEGSGFKAVQQVNDQIHAGFESVKANTFLPPQDAVQAAHAAVPAINDIPLLTDAQKNQIMAIYSQKIAPAIQKAQQAGQPIDGTTAQKISVELGDLARSHLNSSSPGDHPLGQAFYILRSNLNAALKSNDPAVRQQLAQLNAGYSRMVPINIATERATGGAKGQFSPDQFAAAARQAKVPSYSPNLALNSAARETLNEPASGLGTAISRNIGIPGVGAGMHFAANQMGIPHEALLAAEAAVAAGGFAAAHALYSEPGIRAMLFGMNLIPSVTKWIVNQPPIKQREFVYRMLVESPAATKKLAAQVGARLAEQQRQPEMQP